MSPQNTLPTVQGRLKLDLLFKRAIFSCLLVMFNKKLSLDSLSEGELNARINLEKHLQKNFHCDIIYFR